jgi:dGTPase
LELEQLSAVTVFARHLQEVKQRYAQLDGRRAIHETVRRMINTLITDLVAQSSKNITQANPGNIDGVRTAPMLIGFSDSIRAEQRELKQFLRTHMYQHYRVNRMSSKARQIIKALFEAFMEDPKLLPPQYQDKAKQDQARTIADYIAGMTDRYAVKEYRHLFSVEEL